MNKKNPILKNTLLFMGSFGLVTFLFLLLVFGLFLLIPTQGPLTDLIPVNKVQDPAQLDWDRIGQFGGKGVLIDREGRVLKTYKTQEVQESYQLKDLIPLLERQAGPMDQGKVAGESAFAYYTPGGDFLLLTYPSDLVYITPTMNLNTLLGQGVNGFFLALVGLFILYMAFLFLLIRRLTKKINGQIWALKKEEDQRKDLLFQGIAHDTKTPLSSIIAFSQALSDNLVEEDKKEEYYQSIGRNAYLLRDRINEMLDFSQIQEGRVQKTRGDILEFIRRYVGDNYTYYYEAEGEISLLFPDSLSYMVDFDPSHFERVLQNILQNSIQHNPPGVQISIDFKGKKLYFKDSGQGVPKEIVDKVFDPMVTGDQSRTGEKLRGLGLANVKRIVDLHGWSIEYKDGFIIHLGK